MHLLTSVALATTFSASSAYASDSIKIGVLATLEGAYTVLGEDALRGVKTALKKDQAKSGGKQIQLIVQSTDTTAKSAISGAKKLIENGVDIIIGPLSSAQGVAIRDFSKTNPQTTFLNGISGAVAATYIDPSENFFRFTTDNVQWSAGLGDYAYSEKEYKKIAIVADDYAFNHAQVFGFVNEFCSAGGEISDRHWLPLGEKNYSQTIAKIGDDVDAIYLGFSGADTIRFLHQYKMAGGTAKFIGSSITVDGILLNAPDEIKQSVIGMPSSGPQADTWADEKWQAYVKDYKDSFPPDERFVAPSILATGYYTATSAALTCLDKVDGNFSEGQAKFRQCLSTIEFDGPNGTVKLDENRQAIANNFVTEIAQQDDGTLVKKLVRIRENVNQTMGLSKNAYNALGVPDKLGPVCQASN